MEIATGVYLNKKKIDRGYICPYCGDIHYHGGNERFNDEIRMSHCENRELRDHYILKETEKQL